MNSHAAAAHYTAAEVAAATGVSPETQLQWHDRPIIIPSRNDVRPTGTGDKRLMSRETVYQLALTAALARLGIPAKQAACAARLFTDRSSPSRPAGKLFPRGRTVLVTRPTGSALLNAELDVDFFALADGGISFVAIDVAAVVRDVNEKLDQLKQD
jgi:DNA-binding transcriptional MerR regulator